MFSFCVVTADGFSVLRCGPNVTLGDVAMWTVDNVVAVGASYRG